MTDNKDSDLLPMSEVTTDISVPDQAKIAEFIEQGLPGIAKVEEVKLYKVMDLYLSGKTYSQISQITGLKRIVILYLSQKFDWYGMKKQYLYELESSIRNRIVDAKIMSQDFLLQLIQFWQFKIGKKINNFFATGEETRDNLLDPKEIDRYLKTVELIYKLTEGKTSHDGKPTVGLNLGDGVTVKKLNNNEVEITPKQKSIGDMLKQFADHRRAEENKSKTAPNDINNDSNTEGEDNES